MYLTLIILAAVGVLLTALSAVTALVRSIAERRNHATRKAVDVHGRR